MPDFSQIRFSKIRLYGLALLIALAALFIHSYVRAQTPEQDQLEQGARLFAENCAVCHGTKGEGRVGATLAKDWPSIRPDLEVRTTIENGISGSPMPAWGQKNGGPLTDTEIDALVVYILSWSTGGPPVIPPTPTFYPRPAITSVPNVEGDPNRGSALYDQNCAVCHGPNGEGRIGATLDKVWPSIRPDLEIKATISEGVEGSPMPAWSQANGGPLTEGEINDLVAFILTFKPTRVEVTASPTPALPGPAASAVGIVLAVVLIILVVWIAIAVQSRGRKQGE
jgi:quinol---cytochrome-c reductase cytochrome c subunit